jgi:hypothetical protein
MLTMNRPCLFSALALAMSIATPETGSTVFAQAYPSRTIRLPMGRRRGTLTKPNRALQPTAYSLCIVTEWRGRIPVMVTRM